MLDKALNEFLIWKLDGSEYCSYRAPGRIHSRGPGSNQMKNQVSSRAPFVCELTVRAKAAMVKDVIVGSETRWKGQLLP